MRLQDDGNINRNVNNIAPHAGKFMYMHQYKKFPEIKSNRKKFSFLNSQNLFADEEPIEFNDLDSNMLNRDMVKFLPTDSLRLELLIERAEKKLKVIDEEIAAAELLEFDNQEEKELLEKKRKNILHNIRTYKIEYRSLGAVYKFADILIDLKIIILNIIRIIIDFIVSGGFIKSVFEKIPGYHEKQKLKKMNLLHKKLYRELNKSSNADSKKLEYLFHKTEEIGL